MLGLIPAPRGKESGKVFYSPFVCSTRSSAHTDTCVHTHHMLLFYPLCVCVCACWPQAQLSVSPGLHGNQRL